MSTQPHPAPPRLEVHADAKAASHAVAAGLAARARAAVEARGRFSVALSGGSAPVEAYRLLGEEPYRSQVPWEAVHLFWGDERCVPPAHERSNYGMAEDAFIRRVPIPAENVHRMRGELSPADGAAAYAEEVAAYFGSGVPRFDLIHLGIGPDGHTASLFPFAPTLRVWDRTVIHALYPPLGEWRITLTLPALLAAARVEFLALGRSKADIVRAAVRGPLDPFRVPAQLIRPAPGELAWVLDEGAASGL